MIFHNLIRLMSGTNMDVINASIIIINEIKILRNQINKKCNLIIIKEIFR